MKFRLRLPPRAPAWLVAAGAGGTLQSFRLKLRWNGAYRLASAALPAGRPCIVVVDRALPFRRKLQRLPESGKARQALLRTAPGEFPMAPEQMRYALGIHGDEGYLYALQSGEVDGLRERGLRPAIVLVAGGELDAPGALATFENYQRYGETMDLLRERRFLSRRRLLQLQLAAALLAGLLAVGAALAAPDLIAGILEQRASALREQGGALPRLVRVTEKMAYAQAEAARLYASPEARLPGLLARLFADPPAGHSIRTIEMKEGVLKITGNGVRVEEWLVGLGFPADRIVVESLGSFQRFRAERPL